MDDAGESFLFFNSVLSQKNSRASKIEDQGNGKGCEVNYSHNILKYPSIALWDIYTYHILDLFVFDFSQRDS